MTGSYPDELKELIDRNRITDLLMQYCRGVDRVDRDLIASCYHAEGTCEFGSLLLRGADQIGDAISKAAGSYPITFHMIGTPLINIRSDVAGSETYFFSVTTVEEEGGSKQLRMRAGRYVDRIEKRDGQWKILTRVVVEDWCRFIEKPDLPEGVSFRLGQQGRSDPLYAMLEALGD